MATNLTPEEQLDRVITASRACVRIIEAADALLDKDPVWTERLLLRLVRALYTHRLRGLVAVLPAEVTAETLRVAASDKITGPVRGFSNN